MQCRGVTVTVGLLAVLLGTGTCGGGGEDPPSVLTSCCGGDSPACPGFDDTGAWNPDPGHIQDVALATLHTKESIRPEGGKPYHQMRMGMRSSGAAQFFACALEVGLFDLNADWIAHQAWCSETISFWHREARIPYATGYRQSTWHFDWQLDRTSAIRLFYETEEEAGGRGRWIHWNELDYSNPELGVNIPTPGSYIYLHTHIAGDAWNGWSHSMLIDEMTIYRSSSGVVNRIEVTILEGNWTDEVINEKVIPDLRDYTPWGDSDLGDNRRFLGFGVDLDSAGLPIYDLSRLHEISVVDYELPEPPPPDPKDFLWETYYAPLVIELVDFARIMKRGQGPGVTPSVPDAPFQGIPDGADHRWVFPADLEQQAPEGLEIALDLHAEHPLPVQTLLFQWSGSEIPHGFRVYHAAGDEVFHEALVPDPGPQRMPFREDGFAAMPIPVSLGGETGATVRYLKFFFPPGSLAGVAALEELRFHFNWGPAGEDDPNPER